MKEKKVDKLYKNVKSILEDKRFCIASESEYYNGYRDGLSFALTFLKAHYERLKYE